MCSCNKNKAVATPAQVEEQTRVSVSASTEPTENKITAREAQRRPLR